MSELYPLKFKSIFKEKIWGGQKIRTILRKDFGNLENCGETWELSGVEGNISVVSNGAFEGSSIKDLIKHFQSDLLGKEIFEKFGDEFPLLIKFIDAAEDLSIQVHPDDELAMKRHNSRGKSELWYILQADKGASLISGFNRKINKEKFQEHFESGKLVELLNSEKVEKSDVFYLPAGRIHTIGKGIMLAEIQPTTDITYRIYDFERIDKDGNKRELHVHEALDAIDFSFYENYKTQFEEIRNQANPIITTPFFTTNKLVLDKKIEIDRSTLDCFKIYIGVGGSATIAGEALAFGDVMLIPAMVADPPTPM